MKKRLPVICLLVAASVTAVSLMACSESAGQQNTVMVSGVGIVKAQPDTIRMDIILRHTAATTQAAQEQVTVMVRQALEILQSSGVEERNIGTASLRFFPEYEWGQQGRRLLGQRAEQAISFSIASSANGNAPAIIDQLIRINGIELQGMSFSVAETAELHTMARELAYKEALGKAQQLAGLSGQTVVKARSIFEDVRSGTPAPARARSDVMFAMAEQSPSEPTVLPTGDMEISARVSVEFIMR